MSLLNFCMGTPTLLDLTTIPTEKIDGHTVSSA